MRDYPEYVPHDEIPEATVENVPDEIVAEAISWAVDYGACPFCDERQWMNIHPGHNSEHECVACGETMTVVG